MKNLLCLIITKFKQSLKLITVSILDRGLKKSISRWFFAVSIIPILVILVINYLSIYYNRYKFLSYQIKSVNYDKAVQLENYFNQLFKNVENKSKQKETIRSLQNLKKSLKQFHLPFEKIFKGKKWKTITEKYYEYYNKYRQVNSFYNIFLIDNNGNVIFSILNNDYPSNILKPKYSKTKFSIACQKVLNYNKIIFSDFERFHPSDYLPTAYVITAVYNKRHQKIGLLAIQINSFEIDKIIEQETGLGPGSLIYLIGSDFKLRSNLRSGYYKKSGEKIITDQTQKYKEHVYQHPTDDKHIADTCVYLGINNKKVIGHHFNFDIGDVSMAMITEVEMGEAFSFLNDLWDINLIILLLAIFIVLILAVGVTKKIVNPINEITDWIKRISLGDLSDCSIDTKDNEIANLNISMRELIANHRNIVLLANKISDGDFSYEIYKRSKGDELAIALQKMTEALRETSGIVEKIADGNYDVYMPRRGSRDLLSRSINKMTLALKDNRQQNKKLNHIRECIEKINKSIIGNFKTKEIALNIITILSRYTDAKVGIILIADNKSKLIAQESYAVAGKIDFNQQDAFNTGLVGQAVNSHKEIIVENVPDDYMKIRSATLELQAKYILVVPIIYNNKVNAVIELGKVNAFSEMDLLVIDNVKEIIAIAVETIFVKAL